MPSPEELRAKIAALERQVAELQGLRVLVGGLAHDFNNLLTAIGGHATMVEVDAGSSSDAAESAKAILKATEHAGAIAEQLQNIARRRQAKRTPVNLNDVVSDVVALLRPTTPDGILIRQELRAKVAETVADPDQMLQLVLNLALNAREAMPEGGVLTLETAIDEGGANVVVIVRDTGKGMTDDVRERIFEPFFTTRDGDGGTGLGLAVAAGIARTHFGTIGVETSPAAGSVFRVRLPAAPKMATRAAGS